MSDCEVKDKHSDHEPEEGGETESDREDSVCGKGNATILDDSQDSETSVEISDYGSNANKSGFFIEKTVDGSEYEEDNESDSVQNDDGQHISEKSELISELTKGASTAEVRIANICGRMPTLWEIACMFLEKHYAGDIDKVKALYVQLLAATKAKSLHRESVTKSEITDKTSGRAADENTVVKSEEESKSDTSGVLTDTDEEEDEVDSRNGKMDDEVKECNEGSTELVIGTLSEISVKKDGHSSDMGSGSNSSTSDSESESCGSQPDSNENVKSVESAKEKLQCAVDEKATMVMSKRTLKEIDCINTDRETRKENISNVTAPQDCDDEILDLTKAKPSDALSKKFMIKSPPLIDISNDSKEDYHERSMDEASGSQIHGDNGE